LAQGVSEIFLASTPITFSVVSPLVKFPNADGERLKPTPATLMAVTLIDWPVVGLETFQQEPQLVEFQKTSKAPPMNGKEGMSPNVGNFVSRPLIPLEHATVAIEPLLTPNLGLNMARKGEGVGGLNGPQVEVGSGA